MAAATIPAARLNVSDSLLGCSSATYRLAINFMRPPASAQAKYGPITKHLERGSRNNHRLLVLAPIQGIRPSWFLNLSLRSVAFAHPFGVLNPRRALLLEPA